MKIFPAIDLKNGRVVRLTEGDFSRMTVYEEDPCGVRDSFLAAGASHLHVVDLDGAKEGSPKNFEAVRALAGQGKMFVEVGGGIRDEARVCAYLEAGVSRVILGTVAHTNFAFVEQMVRKYGEQIAVGVDAREGKLAVSGWLETTGQDAMAFCKTLARAGVKTVIYTDISRDGALKGTNLPAYRALSKIEGLGVVASGGITFLCEIRALREMGIEGAILGKALYEKKLDLKEALAAGEGEA